MRKLKPFKFLSLPENFCPIDATVEEVASFRRESVWTMFEKIRDGRCDAYLDGRGRKIIFASVLADRDRAIAAGRYKKSAAALKALASRKPPEKRPVGRPRKSPAETAPASAAE
jgi:hypothetical protein